MFDKFSFLIVIVVVFGFFLLVVSVNLRRWNIFCVAARRVWRSLIWRSLLTDWWCAWVVCAWSIAIGSWIWNLTSIVCFSFFYVCGLRIVFWRRWCEHSHFLRRFGGWGRWILLCLWLILRRISLWSWIRSNCWGTYFWSDIIIIIIIIWVWRRIRVDKRMSNTMLLWTGFFLIPWRLAFPRRSACGRGIFFFLCKNY